MIHLLFAFTMLALGGLFLFLRPGLKTLERLRRLHLEVLATGRPATGQILRMDPTGNVGGTKGLPVLELLLRVQVSVPGQPVYTVKTRQLVDQHRVASVQPGQQVFLRVDPENPKRIALTDTPGEETDAGYRGAPSGERASPARPAEPLFSPQRVQTSNAVLSALLPVIMLVMLGNYLHLGVNWAALSPPPGGFCAAAVRCCQQLPRSPEGEVIVKLAGQGAPFLEDRCSWPQRQGANCQRLYESFKKEAQGHQIRCE